MRKEQSWLKRLLLSNPHPCCLPPLFHADLIEVSAVNWVRELIWKKNEKTF